MSTHTTTAATQPEANQPAATQTTGTVEKAIPAPPAEDTTAQLTAEEVDTKAPVGTAEHPSTGSREGTHHTSATTADQTLVENAVPHSEPAAASESLPTSHKAAHDEPHTTAIQEIAPAHPKTSAAAPPVQQQQPSSHFPPATPPPPPPVAMPSSHPGPSSSARAARKPKTPTRKKLMRFLLPCFHPSMHDDSSSAAVLSSRPPPPHASSHHQHADAQQLQASSSPSQEMVEATATTTTTPTTGGPTADADPHLGGASSSLKSSGTTSRRSPMLIAKQHLRKTHKNSSAHAAAAPLTTRRSPSSQCLPTPVSDTVTPAGAAAATSAANAHGGGGVQVPIDETEGMLSGAVVPPGKDTMAIRKSASALRLVARTHHQHQHHSSSSLSSQHAADALAVAAGVHQVTAPPIPLPDKAETDEASSLASPDDPLAFQDIDDSEEDDEEDRIVAMGGMGIPTAPDGSPCPLLAPLDPALLGRKCLVLDLDETLVHSSFKVIPQSDFVVPVEIENAVHNVHVIKRPGVDEFMRKMGALYEVVVFTASLSKYADPVLDMLDIHHVVKHRLFRESCYNHKGNYVKDLSQLGRPIADTIIIDNSPASYVFHPNNAVPVSSWFNDPHDTELTDLAAFLTDIANVPDVRGILDPRL